MQNDNNLKVQLIKFVSEEICVNEERISMDTDILRGFGVDGDDVCDLMNKFSEKFKVNMDDYIWYYHGGPEGCNPFSFIIELWKPKLYIPVTVRILIESVKSGKWELEYPKS